MSELPPIEAGPYALVAAILQCRVEELTPDSSMTTHPKWDSFAHLDIMLALAEHFRINIDEDSIARYSVLAGIIDLYESRGRI
jgi:acyl carrier protein